MGDAHELAGPIEAFLDACGAEQHRDICRSMLETIGSLVHQQADPLDLKLANAALAEMVDAFRVFAPYRDAPKTTFFGSARTEQEDPNYLQARRLAKMLAAEGWMVVTGAGPGIMQAAMEGAGTDRSLGANIRLPHEQGANPFIAQDPKLVEMRYFFTRKLMLIKESDAYVVLPGGFGTLDEGHELLTLLQTGKAQPAPVVLLEVPGGSYWRSWEHFISTEVLAKGLIDPDDRFLYRITDDVVQARSEILGFYTNYHSCRFVGDLLVIRLHHAPSARELTELTRDFRDILAGGSIRTATAFPPERSAGDHLELDRIAFRFNRSSYGRLRQLIDVLNTMAG